MLGGRRVMAFSSLFPACWFLWCLVNCWSIQSHACTALTNMDMVKCTLNCNYVKCSHVQNQEFIRKNQRSSELRGQQQTDTIITTAEMVPFRINALFCQALVTVLTVYSGVWPTCIPFKIEEQLGKIIPHIQAFRAIRSQSVYR